MFVFVTLRLLVHSDLSKMKNVLISGLMVMWMWRT